VLAEEQCQQAAAARENALVAEADKQRQKDALANEQHCLKTVELTAALQVALEYAAVLQVQLNTGRAAAANKHHRCKSAKIDAATLATAALTDEKQHQVEAERVLALATAALANEQQHWEEAERALALATEALAKAQLRRMEAESSLTDEQRRHDTAK
jgi:hypothetical protein